MYFQFFLLNAFFWMNVMAFDIFQRFRTIRPTPILPHSLNYSKQRRKLIWYAVYATGSPLIITAITAVLQFVDVEDAIGSELKPNFGKSNCFFNEDKPWSSFVLFYIPLLLLQVSPDTGEEQLNCTYLSAITPPGGQFINDVIQIWIISDPS